MKIKWYQWINPFFWMELVITAHVIQATKSIKYNVTEEVKKEINNKGQNK